MTASQFCQMEFKKDAFGRELLLKDGKFQVMMEWEKPYMEACIDALKPQGDVLEIGFGCGYSATRIQTYQPSSHTIIEYHPTVILEAREWAKHYPNVRIIHDTWQDALSRLGEFDVIFFDDYPLQSEGEMKILSQKSQQSTSLMQNGQKLMKEVLELFPFLHSVQYSDEDLQEFVEGIRQGEKKEGRHLVYFLHELEQRKQIEPNQCQKAIQQLYKEGLISESDQKGPLKEKGPFSFSRRGDRFFEFLERCLKSHMKKDARFSCYLEDPTSKFEDPIFFEKVITNPFLEYHEERIQVEVPSNCSYYGSSEALVMTITKRGLT